MKETQTGVKDFFEEQSGRWDNIYAEEKRLVHRLIDLFFHGTIQKRFEMTLRELAPFDNKSILDVGCGPGRYSVEFAVRGARKVTGIDFSQNMISLAREAASQRSVAGKCSFTAADFLKFQPDEMFDAAVAIGFFEYFSNTQELFDKIASVTRGTIVISFPKLWTLRTFPRIIRYKIKRCYLRFFTAKEIEQLAASSATPVKSVRILETDRDFLLVCST